MNIQNYFNLAYKMLKYIKEPLSLQGKTLIINGISAGYVPTFAFDHLIPLNSFKRVAYLQSDYLEPSVGYLPQNIEEGAIGLPAELYVSGSVCLLQFRSTLRFARKKDFAKQIAALVKSQKIGDVVLIGSLPASIKPDREITSLQKNIYYKVKGVHTDTIKIEKCVELGYAESIDSLKDSEEEEQIILSSSGICGAVTKELDNSLILLMFNQIPEDKETGVFLAKQLNKFIDRKQISKTK